MRFISRCKAMSAKVITLSDEELSQAISVVQRQLGALGKERYLRELATQEAIGSQANLDFGDLGDTEVTTEVPAELYRAKYLANQAKDAFHALVEKDGGTDDVA